MDDTFDLLAAAIEAHDLEARQRPAGTPGSNVTHLAQRVVDLAREYVRDQRDLDRFTPPDPFNPQGDE